MGEALICGFLNAGMCTPDRISVSVRSEERSQRMLSLGVQVREQGALLGPLNLCDVSSCEACGGPVFLSSNCRSAHSPGRASNQMQGGALT